MLYIRMYISMYTCSWQRAVSSPDCCSQPKYSCISKRVYFSVARFHQLPSSNLSAFGGAARNCGLCSHCCCCRYLLVYHIHTILILLLMRFSIWDARSQRETHDATPLTEVGALRCCWAGELCWLRARASAVAHIYLCVAVEYLCELSRVSMCICEQLALVGIST